MIFISQNDKKSILYLFVGVNTVFKQYDIGEKAYVPFSVNEGRFLQWALIICTELFILKANF